MARSDIELPRSTLAKRIGATGGALLPLPDRLADQLRQQPILHADETPMALTDLGALEYRSDLLFANGFE